MEPELGQAQQQQDPHVQEEEPARVGSNAARGSASTGAPAEASTPPQTRSSAERAAAAYAANGAPGDAPAGASSPPQPTSNAERLLVQLQRRHASASSTGSWPPHPGDSRVELLPGEPVSVYLVGTGPDRSGASAAAHRKGKGKAWRIPLSSEIYGASPPPNPAFAAASGAGPSGVKKDEEEEPPPPPQQLGESPKPQAKKTAWSKFKGCLKKILHTKGAHGKPHVDHQAISTANAFEHYADPLYDAYVGECTLPMNVMGISVAYSKFRPVLGDGNCFYRSFIFSYLEQVLDRQDAVEEERLVDAVERVAMRHAQLGWTSEFSKGHKAFQKLIKKVMRWKRQGRWSGVASSTSYRKQKLLKFFSTYDKTGDIFGFLRLVVAVWMCSHREEYEPLIPGLREGYSLKDWCFRHATQPREMTDHVQMTALTRALGVPLTVERLIQGPAQEIYTGLGLTYVTLLFTGNHYDILYRRPPGAPSAAPSPPPQPSSNAGSLLEVQVQRRAASASSSNGSAVASSPPQPSSNAERLFLQLQRTADSDTSASTDEESCKKKVRTNSAAASLPDDLILEILSRIPASSVHRFQFASKHWRDLVSHPDHRKKLPQTLAGFFYNTYEFFRKPRILPHFTSLYGQPPVDPSLPFLHRGWEVSGLDTCNGLLLCQCYKTSSHEFSYVVCNPTSGRWLELPPSPTRKQTYIVIARLAFDPAVSSHYHVLEFLDMDQLINITGVNIYSSQYRIWKHVVSGWDEDISLDIAARSVFLDGMLHLISHRSELVAVDIKGESWSIFRDMHISFIGLSQGCLHCVLGVTASHMSVWCLEDYRSNRWINKLDISTEELFEGRGQMWNVIGIHPDQDILFFATPDNAKLAWYYMLRRQFDCSIDLQKEAQGPCLPYIPLFSERFADADADLCEDPHRQDHRARA